MAQPPSTSAASEELGFRPPQFSDDLDWLPTWLQSHVTAMPSPEVENADPSEPLDVLVQEPSWFRGSHSHAVGIKDLSLRTESRCNRFHLYLSGEEDTQASCTPSSDKFAWFTLHLSTDGSSASSFYSPMDNSQVYGPRSSVLVHKDVLKQPFHCSGESIQQSIKDNCCSVKSSSATFDQKASGSSCGRAQHCPEEDAEKECLPIQDILESPDPEISDAVELSVAASEALVLYEMTVSEPSLKHLSTTAILDLALRVKQSRLEWPMNDSTFTKEDVTNDETLSDLDGSDMEDAYDDVGVSSTRHVDIYIRDISTSRVADTPISEQPSGYVKVVGSNQLEHHGTQFDDPLTKEHPGSNKIVDLLSGDLSVDSVKTKRQKMLKINPDLDVVPGMVVHPGSMINQSHPSQSYAFLGSKCRRAGNLIMETSYFSESADIAPDAQSCAHNCTAASATANSKLQMEVLCRTGNSWLEASAETPKDSSLYCFDPLCSVVPCSISTQLHTSSPVSDNAKGVVDVDEGIEPELNNEAHTGISSSWNFEAVCRESEEQTVANVDSRPVIRRQMTLSAYSGLIPGQQICLTGKSLDHRQAKQTEGSMQLHSCQEKLNCVNSATVKNLMISDPNSSNGHEGLYYESTGRDTSSREEIRGRSQLLGTVENDGPEVNTDLQNQQPQSVDDFTTEKGKLEVVPEPIAKTGHNQILESLQFKHEKPFNLSVLTRKRVCFKEPDFCQKKFKELPFTYEHGKISIWEKRKNHSDQQQYSGSLDVKARLTRSHFRDRKRLIFHGLYFLLTGFSSKKKREIEQILRRYGGVVLLNIPSPPNRRPRNSRRDSTQLPVILCKKKVQTTEFLYGCAVNAFLLHADWVTDSIKYGSVLPPDKYLILSNHPTRRTNEIHKLTYQNNNNRLFSRVGIILHGDHSFCCKLAEVIKHGHGHVYKSLHWLVQSRKNETISVGVVIAENEMYATRHLRKCALEQSIPMMPPSWIVNSLYNGELLPFGDNNLPFNPSFDMQEVSVSQQWTQEI